jgi:hypothetical protein
MQKSFPPSSAPLRQVKRIQFGLLSPDEIVRWVGCALARSCACALHARSLYALVGGGRS